MNTLYTNRGPLVTHNTILLGMKNPSNPPKMHTYISILYKLLTILLSFQSQYLEIFKNLILHSMINIYKVTLFNKLANFNVKSTSHIQFL